MKKPVSVDAYLASRPDQREFLSRLRRILLNEGLEETVKWGTPCYTMGGKNVIGLGAFKSYCGLWFFQGALLEDPAKVLVNAQEGKTRALRQWRFQPDEEIDEALIARYVREAVENQRQGREVSASEPRGFTLPPELERALAGDSELRTCFDGLTAGRRREYAEYIGEAKRSETKQKRLAKILPMIRSKVGLSDRYRGGGES